MKKQILLLATTLAFSVNTFAKTKSTSEPKQSPTERSRSEITSISFTENKGQVHDQNYAPRPDVLYGVKAGNMAVHIKKTGISYQLYRVDSYKEVDDFKTEEKRQEIDQQTIYRIDLTWLNANTNFTKTEDETLPGYSNYYLENCPNGALNVRSYKGIRLNGLYKGIDLHYYEKNGDLKHDYIVAPHADYKQIQLQVEGADISINKDGSLLLTTPLGKIQEGAPIVYQNEKELKAKWILKKNTLSFEVESYNPNYELIIDPVTRIWGTYYGDISGDDGLSCTIDFLENVYMAGITEANTGTIIATSGSHQTAYGSNTDAFLAKFNPNGIRLWSTYYGGSGGDTGYSCVTDASGNVYMSGWTLSTSGMVIATPGSHQPVSTNLDAFLVKFNSNGVRLWGTYYGDSGDEYGRSCAVDLSGNVYMSGRTNSYPSTILATSGSHQVSHAGSGDAFLVKFDPNGNRQWGTYYGGGSDDSGKNCATDPFGNVYLCGEAPYYTLGSGTIIATPGSHQPTHGGGSVDAFLVKFNSSGVRQWGTFYGGTSADANIFCTTDLIGNVFLTGYTNSTIGTFIATIGSHQPTHSGLSDAFLVKFNSSGVRQWGTYCGGPENNGGLSCTTDALGNIYMSGYTELNSGSAIATPGSHQSIFGGNLYDAFLIKFNANGVRQWGTFYGGTGWDYGWSCSADASGNIYMTGMTESKTGTFIATSGSHQSTIGGASNYYNNNSDAYLVKFKDCINLNPVVLVNSTFCNGEPINLSVSIPSTVNPTFYWSGPNFFTSTIINPVIGSAQLVNTGIYTVTVDNSGCVETATTQINVIMQPIITANSGTICLGKSFTITPGGASTYTIQGTSFIVSPVSAATYTVAGTSTAGCVSSNTAISSVAVNPLPNVSVSTSNSLICIGEEVTLTASGASSYVFNPGGSGASITVSPTQSSSYTVTGTDANGCLNTANITQNVDECTGVANNDDPLTKDGVPLSAVEVFPNPTSGIIILKLNANYEIIILNAIGQIVYSSKFKAGENQINLEGLAKGVYLLRLGDGLIVKNIKVVME